MGEPEMFPRLLQESDLSRPALHEVAVSEFAITTKVINDLLESRNNSTQKTRMVELLRTTFVARHPSGLYLPSTDHMQQVYERLPAWIGVEGSPHGKGNFDRITRILANSTDLEFLDEEYDELNKDYEWVRNAVHVAKAKPYHDEPKFGLVATKLIALESHDEYWLNYGE
jgi:hypothetical protein